MNPALLAELFREDDEECPVTARRPDLAEAYAEVMNSYPESEYKWKSQSFSRAPRR